MDKGSNIMRYFGGQKNGRKWYWEIFPLDALSVEEEAITAVVGLFKYNGEYLAVKNNRGWDIPGGHREVDELPERAISREVAEEANAVVDGLKPLCYLRSDRDTKATYILVYTGIISSYSSFTSTGEITERNFFTGKELLDKYGGNKRLLRQLLLL